MTAKLPFAVCGLANFISVLLERAFFKMLRLIQIVLWSERKSGSKSIFEIDLMMLQVPSVVLTAGCAGGDGDGDGDGGDGGDGDGGDGDGGDSGSGGEL